jgi:hypothetical protein
MYRSRAQRGCDFNNLLAGAKMMSLRLATV